MTRDPRAFMAIGRVADPERDPAERVRDYGEIFGVLPADELRRAGRPLHGLRGAVLQHACPLGNLIPDWNDLVRRDDWKAACEQLHATNNFPEFTGLICPAPCESACVLAIDDDPVMIKQIEYAIVHRGFEEGWIVARPPERRTGRSVAVVGSGPAGLAAAAELNQVGHTVTVYERDEGPGGLMRFGVPDAKLEKWMIDRRVELLEAEGIRVRVRSRRRRQRRRRRARRGQRRGRDRDRLAGRARLRGPRARARRRALRDGLPLPAKPLGRRARRGARRASPSRGRRSSPPASTWS